MNCAARARPDVLLKAKLRPKELDRRSVVEMWLYRTAAQPRDLHQGARSGGVTRWPPRRWNVFTNCGIEIGGGQQTKTKAALEFFKADLASSGPGTVAK
jgi:hypothetical protein